MTFGVRPAIGPDLSSGLKFVRFFERTFVFPNIYPGRFWNSTRWRWEFSVPVRGIVEGSPVLFLRNHRRVGGVDGRRKAWKCSCIRQYATSANRG